MDLKLITTVRSTSLLIRLSMAICTAVSGHPRHSLNRLIPRVAVGVAVDVGGVAEGLTTLRPRASGTGVVARHIGRVAVLLHVVVVA